MLLVLLDLETWWSEHSTVLMILDMVGWPCMVRRSVEKGVRGELEEGSVVHSHARAGWNAAIAVVVAAVARVVHQRRTLEEASAVAWHGAEWSMRK